MGAGLCDTNRLNPLITREMILIYVVPSMLYSLKTEINGRTQITQIEDFYRTLLRRVQSLAERVTKEAVYLLISTLHLEAILHICILKLLQKIASNSSSLLHGIALRQLAVKDSNSHSWFIHVAELCT